MARPNTTPQSEMSPEPGGPLNLSARSHVSDDIVTGLADPVDAKRYRGFDWVAAFLGFTVAMFFLALFLGIVAVVLASLGYRPPAGSLTAAVSAPSVQGAAAGGLAAILLAYLIGGYAAGRVARFNGGRNGLGVVLWTVIVAIGLGIAGGILETLQFGVAQNLHLGISLREAAIVAAIAAVPALVLMLLGGLLGGALGTRYHRRVDRAVGVPA